MKIALTKPLSTGLAILVLAVPVAATGKGSPTAIPPAAVAWNPPAGVGQGVGANSRVNAPVGAPPMLHPGDPVSPTLPYGLSKRDELPPGLAKRDTLPPGLAKRLN